jgi:hypothetical protein
MSKAVELIPLLCARCQAAIPAQPDEVAWVCSQCGQGLLLSEEKGTVPLTIQYSQGIAPGKQGQPFWVTTGQVTFGQRRIFGGGDQGSQTQQFWAQPYRFFIPAFTLPLDQLIETGTRLLQQPPTLQPGPAAPFLPIILTPEDIMPVAEFIVMGIEANRKDKIKEVQFSVQLNPPELWVL